MTSELALDPGSGYGYGSGSVEMLTFFVSRSRSDPKVVTDFSKNLFEPKSGYGYGSGFWFRAYMKNNFICITEQ